MKRVAELVWGSPKRAVLTTSGAVAFSIWAIIFMPWIRDVTSWLVPAGVVGFLIRQYPNDAKQLWGRALSHLAWINQAVEREAIRRDLEGTLELAAASLEESCASSTSAKVSLMFLKSGEQVAELEDGTLVLAIAHHRDRSQNLVSAAWAFARNGVLRDARAHLDPEVSRGIDFVVTKNILTKSDRNALRLFVEELWQPAISDHKRLRALTGMLESLQDDELFGPVLLFELVELGVRQTNRLPNDGIASETADFVEFLNDLSQREHGQEGPMDFEGQSIRSKFIFVARADVYAVKGSDPYRRAVNWSIDHGYRNIYLLARGHHTEYAVEVAEAFQEDVRVFPPTVRIVSLPRGPRMVQRAVVRIPVDVRYGVGIGQRPLVAVGPGKPVSRRANSRQA